MYKRLEEHRNVTEKYNQYGFGQERSIEDAMSSVYPSIFQEHLTIYGGRPCSGDLGMLSIGKLGIRVFEEQTF